MTVNPLLQKAPYDPERDFVPVTKIGLSQYVLVTGTAFPATNARAFQAQIKTIRASFRSRPPALALLRTSSLNGSTSAPASRRPRCLTRAAHRPWSMW